MSTPEVQFLTQELIDKYTQSVKDDAEISRRPAPPRSPISGGLDPYTGTWDHLQAAHLLRRSMIGPHKDYIEWALENGMDATIDMLLTDRPMPDPPLNYNYPDDPNTPIGETWIDKPFQQGFAGYRRRSLNGWTIGNLLQEEMSVRERMTLFWHNHFVTADIGQPIAVYQYITLLRSYATGNFRDLTKAITINPAMLIYLNGNQNTRNAPNENYARELLELFTVGKGPLAAPGDYTTFTEEDVREIARALTGWRTRFEAETGEPPYSFFNNNLHDTGTKQLSHRFQNTLIENAGAEEYSHLIDIIFMHPETALHICRKLYRWFVYYVIDDTIEEMIIAPLAKALRDHNYEIGPVIRMLLRSAHFYDINSIGCIIKSPLEFVISSTRQFEVQIPAALNPRYQVWLSLFRTMEQLQMTYYSPPSVSGWKAYYQEPGYNQIWINAVTLVIRQLYTDVLSTTGFALPGNTRFLINVLDFTAKISNAQDPNRLIREIAERIYPVEITQQQIDVFKEVLIPGLPDFEWTAEYQAYLADPSNPEVRQPVKAKLRALFRAMQARPEYQLL